MNIVSVVMSKSVFRFNRFRFNRINGVMVCKSICNELISMY